MGAGLPPWIALPAVSALVGLVTWAALARLAWRHGAFGLAVLLLGGPLFLPPGYAILQQRFFGLGLLLVALGLIAADAPTSARRSVFAGFLLSIGTALVPNSVVLASVGLAWLVVAQQGEFRWRHWLIGSFAGAALYGIGQLFYVLDPAWTVHPAPALHLGWAPLLTGIFNLERYMGRVTPSAFLHPGFLLAAMGAVAAAGAARRRWEMAAPAGILAAVAIMALAITKVHEGTPSVFFAFDRMFLGVPLGLGIVAIGAAGPGSRRSPTSAKVVMACGLVVLGAAVWRWTSLPRDVAAEHSSHRTVLNLGDVPGAVAACHVAEAAAKAEGADLVVFLAHRSLAYACGALAYGRITTLYPPYERRTWIIRDEARRQREVIVVPDVDVDSVCEAVLKRYPLASCGVGAQGALVVRMESVSVVDFVRSIGVPVRKF